MDTKVIADAVAARVSASKIIYLAIAGSHIWGLERPDSDLDVRGVYIEPIENLLSLHTPKDTIEFSIPFGDTQLDAQLYEVGKFLRMLCKHNGNMVMLLKCPMRIHTTIALPWAGLSKAFTTKRLAKYYRGYAESQRKRSLTQRGGKALIYTYREMFVGLHVMRYGYPEFDFLKLWDIAIREHWYPYSYGMLQKYWENPTMEISDESWAWFYREWEELCEKLDKECDASSLPDDFDGWEWCNELLLELRKA